MILVTNGKWEAYSKWRIAKFTIHFPGEQYRYSSGDLKLDFFRKDELVRGLNCKARGWFYIEVIDSTILNDWNDTQEFKFEFRKDTEYYMWMRVRPQNGKHFPQRTILRVYTPGSLPSRSTLIPLRSHPGFSLFILDEKP